MPLSVPCPESTFKRVTKVRASTFPTSETHTFVTKREVSLRGKISSTILA